MTLEEFEILDEPRKLDLLHGQGVYIGKCLKRALIVLLFQLESFYVEIYYSEYRKHVHHIKAFDSPAGIDVYLDKINIENLSF